MGRHFAGASFVALWLLAALAAHGATSVEPVRIAVGVILDLASLPGTRWRTTIEMAVEDYYATHANSTTRIELHFRDSSGDAIGAVAAAVDLIKKTRVHALIHGAQTAAEAEFLGHIGGRTHVPVLSYAAATSASHTPFLVRTSPADGSSQAAAIAGILGNFRWRRATLLHLHEDLRFVPVLADALRAVGASVAHRAAVPADASDARLDAVLYQVAAMTTRVLVVHLPITLAVQLFRRAQIAGMMSKGYGWIATAGVAEAAALSPDNFAVIQGVLSVRPYAPATNQATDFAGRYMARLHQENDGSHSQDIDIISYPTVSTIRAYDTASAVAAAVEAAGIYVSDFKPPEGSTGPTELDQLGVSATGEKLLKALRETTFHALAGKFRLSDGELQTPAYEIVNFAGDGLIKTVGFWNRKSGISPEFAADSSDGLNRRARLANSPASVWEEEIWSMPWEQIQHLINSLRCITPK